MKHLFHLPLLLFVLLQAAPLKRGVFDWCDTINHFQPKFVENSRFNIEKDLLLAQFDCKTDVDDLHTVAAFATLLKHPNYKNINFHAVAGTYGIQEGLYVPPENLFTLAFEEDQWSDAHNHPGIAMNEVIKKVLATLELGGDIWVADAGQSDFSAKWLKAVLAIKPNIDAKQRIHIVQHSNWNEEVTNPKLLAFVQKSADYHKIPDGNAVGNGTPGFRSDENINWETYLGKDAELINIWKLAIELGHTYNGKEGRYLNTSVAAGGLDFSDLSEICFMMGLSELKDGKAFFEMISSN